MREEKDRLFNEEVLPLVMVAAFAVLYAIYEWVRWIFNFGPSPIIFTIAAGGVVAWAGYRLRSFETRIRNLKQGLEGELHSAQFMQRELCSSGTVL